MLIFPLGILRREGGVHAGVGLDSLAAFVHAVHGVETGSSTTGSSVDIFQSSVRR